MTLFCPPCAGEGVRSALSTALQCTTCGRQWPVLAAGTDFIAVLVPDPDAAARMVALVSAMLRDPGLLAAWADSEEALESALAGGLLTYAQAHFGAHASPPLPSADLGWLARAWTDELPQGDVAVLGCATAGEAWALRQAPALRDRALWLVDANLAALAWGQMLFDNGSVVLPYRRSATLIAWRTAQLPGPAPNVRWLCADALFPPFAPASLAAVVTVNLLDSVADPLALVQQVEALLAPGGAWIVASPWNWQARVTPVGRQLERHVAADDLEEGMVELLTGRTLAGLGTALAVQWRADDVPWRLQVHPRYAAEYRLQVLRIRKSG
ncbi:MAG: class I SAM-dependent methyltransferase [Deltaproteobacteria bacterium]|nr:class I SAM-dependent methyltransferase [Deltaproteobacteria bacterium]